MFSIILPIYNGEEYLQDTLDSISRQTSQDFEVIIVDDGSQDNSKEIVNKFVSESEFKVSFTVNEKNLGVCESLRYAFHMARGEFLLQIGHDDILDDNYIREMKNIIESNNASVVFGKVNYIDHKGHDFDISIFRHETLLEGKNKVLIELLGGNFLCAPGSVFKRSLFNDNVMSYRNDRLQDYEIWLNLILENEFIYSTNSIINYRWHSNNLSNPTSRINQSKYELYLSMKNVLSSVHFSNLIVSDFSTFELVQLQSNLRRLSIYCPILMPLVLSLFERIKLSDDKDEALNEVIDSYYTNLGLYRKVRAETATSTIPIYIDQSVPYWVSQKLKRSGLFSLRKEIDIHIRHEGMIVSMEYASQAVDWYDNIYDVIDSKRICYLSDMKNSNGIYINSDDQDFICKKILDFYEDKIDVCQGNPLFTMDLRKNYFEPKFDGLKIRLEEDSNTICLAREFKLNSIYNSNNEVISFVQDGKRIFLEKTISDFIVVEFKFPEVVLNATIEVSNTILFRNRVILLGNKILLEYIPMSRKIPFFFETDLEPMFSKRNGFEHVSTSNCEPNCEPNNEARILKKLWHLFKPLLPNKLKRKLIKLYNQRLYK